MSITTLPKVTEAISTDKAWAEFLHYRTRAIHAFRDAGHSFTYIAHQLSLHNAGHAQQIWIATHGSLDRAS